MNCPPLEKVVPTQFYQFSQIENQLAILYANQEKIYTMLKLLVALEEKKLGCPIEIK